MISLLIPAYMSFASRLFGSEIKCPRLIKISLYTLPYAIITLILLWGTSLGAYGCLFGGILIFLMASLGKSTGHGQYFLELLDKPIKPEKLDFLVRPFFGKDPRTLNPIGAINHNNLYWRCVFGLAATGMAVTIGPALIIGTLVSLKLGILLLLTGATKPIPYMLSHYLGDTTIGGEYGSGLYAGLGLVLVYLWA